MKIGRYENSPDKKAEMEALNENTMMKVQREAPEDDEEAKDKTETANQAWLQDKQAAVCTMKRTAEW